MNFTYYFKWRLQHKILRIKARTRYVGIYVTAFMNYKSLFNQLRAMSTSQCFEKGDYYRIFGNYDFAEICYEFGIYKKRDIHDGSWLIKYHYSLGLIAQSRGDNFGAQLCYNLVLLLCSMYSEAVPLDLSLNLQKCLLNLGFDDEANMIADGDIKKYEKALLRIVNNG